MQEAAPTGRTPLRPAARSHSSRLPAGRVAHSRAPHVQAARAPRVQAARARAASRASWDDVRGLRSNVAAARGRGDGC